MWQSWGLNSFTIMGHFLEQVSGIGKLFLVSINFWGGKLLQKEVLEVADTLSSLPHENGRKMQSWEYLTARESALLMWTESISHQILLARLGWKAKMILKSCLQETNQSVEPLLPLRLLQCIWPQTEYILLFGSYSDSWWKICFPFKLILDSSALLFL